MIGTNALTLNAGLSAKPAPTPLRKQEELSWEKVDRLDWHLWTLTILLIFVLGVSLLSFMFPSVFWTNANSALDSSQRAFFGFCTLLGLTLIYLLQRQATVRQLKHRLFTAQIALVASERKAAEESFSNLPGTDQFRDALAMEYRRASTAGTSLAAVLLKAPQASSEHLGLMVKQFRIALRQGEGLFRISDRALGIILPKASLVDARSFASQLESSVENPQLKMEFEVTAYPEDVASLSEMEAILRGLPEWN